MWSCPYCDDVHPDSILICPSFLRQNGGTPVLKSQGRHEYIEEPKCQTPQKKPS